MLVFLVSNLFIFANTKETGLYLQFCETFFTLSNIDKNYSLLLITGITNNQLMAVF